MSIDELKLAYAEKLPVILVTLRGDHIEYERIVGFYKYARANGSIKIAVVLADYCGRSYTAADPRQLRLKESTAI